MSEKERKQETHALLVKLLEKLEPDPYQTLANQMKDFERRLAHMEGSWSTLWKMGSVLLTLLAGLLFYIMRKLP